MSVRISRSLSPALPAYGIVTYHGIPLYRVQAWALELAKAHGAGISLLSGIRNDDVIAAHNRAFGTNLHGQAYLVRAHERDPAHFAPANTPQTTSHCGYADGNWFYGAAGSRIPKIETGIDAWNNPTAGQIVRVLNRIGIPAALPYSTGSELHHFSLSAKNGPNRLRARYARLLVQRKGR